MKIRIILYFSLLFSFCVGFSLVSSAVDTGKVCNGGVYLNSAKTSPQNYMEDPNGDRTYFTVDQVDWSSAPEIIKKIVYSPIPNYTSTMSLGDYPSPFVLVRQNDIDSFMVFAGWNIAVGVRFNYSSSPSVTDGLGFSCYSEEFATLYRASYNISSGWGELTTLDFESHNISDSSTPFYHYYCSMYGSSGLNNRLDWYFYGTNMIKSDSGIHLINISWPVTTTRSLKIWCNYQGMLTNLFEADKCPNYFCSLFTPLTPEQVAQQTQKGIFAKLQELIQKVGNWFVDLRMSITNGLNTLKDNLINGIKSLFVPSDGYFDDLKEDFSDWMEEHFGVLYQSGSLIVDIMEQLRDFEPDESNYPLTIPAIYGSEVVNGEVVNTEISSEHTYAMGDILVQEPFDSLYDVYLTGVSALFYLSLILLAWRKFHKFLEGR